MYLGGTYIAIAEVCPVCGSARFCTEVVVTRKNLLAQSGRALDIASSVCLYTIARFIK